MRSIGSGQVLTMDGQVVGAPFNSGNQMKSPSEGSEGIYKSPNTPGATTGIGESGENVESKGTPEFSSPSETPGQPPSNQSGISSEPLGTEPSPPNQF